MNMDFGVDGEWPHITRTVVQCQQFSFAGGHSRAARALLDGCFQRSVE